jgi:predicted O-methyltransferase YrrM
MSSLVYKLKAFAGFWLKADTVYQVHSPLAFHWAQAVLEDGRRYYAFDDIEALRQQMRASPLTLDVEDYGASDERGQPLRRRVPLRQLAERASSSPLQGRWLFRTAQWLRPERVLELGAGVGVSTAYLAAGISRQARLVSLEGCPTCAQVAEAHLDMLHLSDRVRIQSGPFAQGLPGVLEELGRLDLAFFDGHHQGAATMAYFEQCLPYVHEQSVFVFDDVYWSADMTEAWQRIQAHPRVTLSIDCFELGFVFFNPGLREKQHLRIVPISWKPWKQWL